MTLRKTGVLGSKSVQDDQGHFYVQVVIKGDSRGDDPVLEKLAQVTGGEFYSDQHKVAIPVTGTSKNPRGLDAAGDEVDAAIASLRTLAVLEEFKIQW